MSNRKELAIRGLRNALRARRKANISADAPICVYDLASTLGVEVKFWDVPSMEGIYIKGEPSVIAISSRRPSGRQRITCAHELGHHAFGHGTRVDEYLGESVGRSKRDDDELLADRFAGFLIMPKEAVLVAFEKRGWLAKQCDSLQVYTVACELGSSYQGLVTHMRWSLELISPDLAAQLLKDNPKSIRTSICGEPWRGELLIIDRFWCSEKAADVQAGDVIQLPHGCKVDGNRLAELGSSADGVLHEARSRGIIRVCLPSDSWAVHVRISPRGYVGRAMFRHMENENDDN